MNTSSPKTCIVAIIWFKNIWIVSIKGMTRPINKLSESKVKPSWLNLSYNRLIRSLRFTCLFFQQEDSFIMVNLITHNTRVMMASVTGPQEAGGSSEKNRLSGLTSRRHPHQEQLPSTARNDLPEASPTYWFSQELCCF